MAEKSGGLDGRGLCVRVFACYSLGILDGSFRVLLGQEPRGLFIKMNSSALIHFHWRVVLIAFQAPGPEIVCCSVDTVMEKENCQLYGNLGYHQQENTLKHFTAAYCTLWCIVGKYCGRGSNCCIWNGTVKPFDHSWVAGSLVVRALGQWQKGRFNIRAEKGENMSMCP